MSRPFFSIIIPTYNRCALLAEALKSVNQQLFKAYEIIIIDDGSTDETSTMIASLNFGVIYCKVEHGEMVGHLRNIGASKASADYLAFLDSDDLWLPHKLEIQHQQLIENPSINLLHSKEEWQRYGKVISQNSQKHRHEGNIFKDSLNKCIIGPSTAVINHHFFDAIGAFNCYLEVAEDYELWLRALNQSPCYYHAHPLIIKREGAWANLSHKYEEIESFRIKALELLTASGKLSQENLLLAKNELARKISLYIAGALKRENNDVAHEYYQKLQLIMEKI